ncbi:hypothetical protein CIW49_23020 [Mycolicibacterium sp. P1-18]|nr:hypothetical protein CIW49_23020 [Mycolicibacterium sp. P1-18]
MRRPRRRGRRRVRLQPGRRARRRRRWFWRFGHRHHLRPTDGVGDEAAVDGRRRARDHQRDGAHDAGDTDGGPDVQGDRRTRMRQQRAVSLAQ